MVYSGSFIVGEGQGCSSGDAKESQLASTESSTTRPYRAKMGFETKFLNFELQTTPPEASRDSFNVTVGKPGRFYPSEANLIVSVLGEDIFEIIPIQPVRGTVFLDIGGMHVTISSDADFWASQKLPVTVDQGFIFQSDLKRGANVTVHINEGVWSLRASGAQEEWLEMYLDRVDGSV